MPVGECMTEEQYYCIAHACDNLLRRSDAPLEWIAIPWLHILNEHPVYLADYTDLILNADLGGPPSPLPSLNSMSKRGRASASRFASLAKTLFRSATFATWRKESPNINGGGPCVASASLSADVIILSWLVNVNHLDWIDDFYFGNLQSLLAERGMSSLLVLRNQTGIPASSLLKRAQRDGACSRMLLPDVTRLTEELGFIRRCLRARCQLRQAELEASSLLDRQVARKARGLVVSSAVVGNLRLHEQIVALCHQFKPSVVMTLYEGQAWERCVWHAVRSSGFPSLCVGYQHTILRKHSHAVKRSLGSDKCYNPDLILTVGDVTRGILEASRELRDLRLLSFGTHRRNANIATDEIQNLSPTFLVLPEGIESECIFLFDFALKCARSLPSAHFIFRTHPVLPFERIVSKLKEFRPPPANIEVSSNAQIDDDFARAGYILYRGSSAVIYSVLFGLKPFYICRPGEMTIDPLEGLSEWREYASSVEDLQEKYMSHRTQKDGHNTEEWRRARAFCERYMQPLKENVIGEIIQLAKEVS